MRLPTRPQKSGHGRFRYERCSLLEVQTIGLWLRNPLSVQLIVTYTHNSTGRLGHLEHLISAIKCIRAPNYDCSTSELFQNLKWSKLVHQRAVSKAIMMHSIVNNTAPEYLTSRFVRRCDLTSYNLRENEYKLAVPQPRTEFYKRSLSYSGRALWNSLPLEVRQLTSPNLFKGKLRDINFDRQII